MHKIYSDVDVCICSISQYSPTRTSEMLDHQPCAVVHWNTAIFKLIGAFNHILLPQKCHDNSYGSRPDKHSLTHSLTAALDQLRVVASSTSNDPGPRSRQHQQIGQCLLPLAAANFSVDDPAGASSQQREECKYGLLLTVAVPAKQVCFPVGDRCDQIMNDVFQH